MSLGTGDSSFNFVGLKAGLAAAALLAAVFLGVVFLGAAFLATAFLTGLTTFFVGIAFSLVKMWGSGWFDLAVEAAGED
jgi:hypothetical protein